MDLSSTSPSRLPHQAFFEALAACESESSVGWAGAAAGLVVVRLFDHWVEFGPELLAPDQWEVTAVREAVARIKAGDPIRAILEGIVEAIAANPSGEPARILPRLMAYGRALHYEAKWALSADVYQTVLAQAHPLDECDLTIDAYMQFGYCLRMLGQWPEATDAYTAAGELAAAAGDLVKALRARVAEAKLAMDRGNMPKAEEILDDTLTRTARDAEDLRDIRAVAFHDRAVVAHARGQYEPAARFGYQALQGYREQAARDRALVDIAIAFVELGVYSAARDALVIVAATAREQYVRWAATINLMDIAVREGCEPVFENYRGELEDKELPASLEANYHLHVGWGYFVFHRLGAARVALERARDIAARHQFHEVAFKAEEHLRDVAMETRAKAAKAAESPGALTDIAQAIKEMRSLAGLDVA